VPGGAFTVPQTWSVQVESTQGGVGGQSDETAQPTSPPKPPVPPVTPLPPVLAAPAPELPSCAQAATTTTAPAATPSAPILDETIVLSPRERLSAFSTRWAKPTARCDPVRSRNGRATACASTQYPAPCLQDRDRLLNTPCALAIIESTAARALLREMVRPP